MKKSTFNLSHMHSTTLDAGYLVPILLQETIPNDSFKIGMNSFIRATPMLAPLMHKVNFYTQYWYVPYRLLWEDWQEFITSTDLAGANLTFPTIKAPAEGGFQVGSIHDYFGFPINQPDIEVSAMPYRAMAMIWNTRYRDEDLQTEVPLSLEGGLDTTTSTSLLSPSWKRDYFTLSRNSTQRGSEISVPIIESSGSNGQFWHIVFEPLVMSVPKGATPPTESVYTGSAQVSSIYSGLTSCPIAPPIVPSVPVVNPVNFNVGDVISTPNLFINGLSRDFYWCFKVVSKQLEQGENQVQGYTQNSIKAGMFLSGIVSRGCELSVSGRIVYHSSSLSTSGQLDVRDLRLAGALQRFQEKSLKWGNRYEEFIQREFGIKPKDSRIQRPEYLGGGKSILQISEVLQTAEATDSGVGTMRGHGVASMNQRPIRFTAPEHGLIIGLMSIRPEPVYTQGIHREWLKRTPIDFFLPELANIGMQEVYTQELYATKDNKGTIFGYNDRYQEYRYRAPKVTGEFRTGNYDYWTMARQFQEQPVLNGSFIDMASSSAAFKRPFAEQTQHNFLAMLRNIVIARRPIPKRAKSILK